MATCGDIDGNGTACGWFRRKETQGFFQPFCCLHLLREIGPNDPVCDPVAALLECRRELDEAKEMNKTARKMFDATRHRVLSRLGIDDMGKSWNWIESHLHMKELESELELSMEASQSELVEECRRAVLAEAERDDLLRQRAEYTQQCIDLRRDLLVALEARDDAESSAEVEEARIAELEAERDSTKERIINLEATVVDLRKELMKAISNHKYWKRRAEIAEHALEK